MTVAFVDVVGFTGLGERVEAGDLKSLAMRLVDHATAVVEQPVRLVKTVGDAILLMSRDTALLLDALVALLRSWEGAEDVPPVHIGVARGTTYVGGADVYGASVNLASRVTDSAPAGAVWATRRVVEDAARHGFAPQGSRRFKGAADPVEIFELDRS
jgi:adenylate cyclase